MNWVAKHRNKGKQLFDTIDGRKIPYDEFSVMSAEDQMSVMGYTTKPLKEWMAIDAKRKKGQMYDQSYETEEIRDEEEIRMEHGLVEEALRAKGFECYSTDCWYKHFEVSNRVVQVTWYGDDQLMVDFNEEEVLYISPKTLIKVFLGLNV